jgi:Arc-like DNA binding domain
MAMARKKSEDIISTRLRLPAGLHRMLTASAKRNNRSLNSEVLWCVAQQLGGEAHKLVEQMAVEQRRAMHRVLQALIKDPQRAAKAIENFDEGTGDES